TRFSRDWSSDVCSSELPHPLGTGALLHARLGVDAWWRCHIGLDEQTPATEAAWAFLRPWTDGYAHAVFSLPEYIPSFLAGRASKIGSASCRERGQIQAV